MPAKPKGEGTDEQSGAFALGSNITGSSGVAVAPQGTSGGQLASVDDDFGNFDTSPAPADDFGDFSSEGMLDFAASGAPDGSSSASALNNVSIGLMGAGIPENGDKFGDFESSVPDEKNIFVATFDGGETNGTVAFRCDDRVSGIKYDGRNAGIDAQESDAFGTYFGKEQAPSGSDFARFDGVAQTGAASTDDFDGFNGPVSTDEGFANFDGGPPRKATAASDDFGDFESPEAEDAEQDGFAKFDGSAMGGATLESNDFGDFGGPEPAEDSIGIGETAAEDDEFGDFNCPISAQTGPNKLNGVGNGEAASSNEDFGNFDGAVPAHGGFAKFDSGAEELFPETDEEFGDFKNLTVPTHVKEQAPSAEADQGFGDFAKDASLPNAVDDRIADFDGPSSKANVERVENLFDDDDVSRPASRTQHFALVTTFVSQVFAQLSAPAVAAPPQKARTALTDEEVGAALIKKRWYADGAAWLLAARHRRELKLCREEMEAAAKALRFEEAIQLRGKIERLEAACREDELNAESRLRKAHEGGEVLLISAAHASIREIDSAAAMRLEIELTRLLGGSDFDALLAQMSDPAEAAEAQREAFEAVFATAYARHALGGTNNQPPEAWKAIVVKACTLLDDSLPALRDIADSLAEVDSDLDRNRAKRLADHVVALQTAANVGQSILDAAARAAYEEPPGGYATRDAFESSRRQLEDLAGKLLPPGMQEPVDQAAKNPPFDPPRDVEQLRILPPNICALTLKVLDDHPLSKSLLPHHQTSP